MIGLYDEDEIWREDTPGLENVVTSYFQKMFTAGAVNQEEVCATLNAIQPCVLDVMNQSLCAPYSA